MICGVILGLGSARRRLVLPQATINITGKCKGVTLDSCEQVKVLLDSALSSVELVNCKRMQVQIRGQCPTVAIDKTDGCLVSACEGALFLGV